MEPEDQNTSLTLKKNSESSNLNTQDMFNAIGAVAMRNDVKYSEEGLRIADKQLKNSKRDLSYLLVGMSAEAKIRLEMLKQEIKHYELLVQLYSMVIKEKMK